MQSWLNFFKDDIPSWIFLALMIIFFLMQGIGEFLEFKGKIVPEFMKIRKFFKRRKEERLIAEEKNKEVSDLLAEVKVLLSNVDQHYSTDNIAKRDKWMEWVNNQATVYDTSIAELKEAMKENNKITLSILIDNQRNFLLDFTSKAVDMNYPLSREQYHRFYTVYAEYEEILKKNNMENGQVNVAYGVVTRSFEERLKTHAFIEDREHGL